MPILVAHYDVEMPGQCLSAWPEDEVPSFSCVIDGFDVNIELVCDTSWAVQGKDEPYETRSIAWARISVARRVDKFPPPVIPHEDGVKDYSIQRNYFDAVRDDFREAAREAANRTIRFFRYCLNTPLLREIPPRHQSVTNAKWTDNRGESVGKDVHGINFPGIRGRRGELGVQRLTPDNSAMLTDFLNAPVPASLSDEILSDAQGAWFEGHLRRAILELAIACEIIVKRRFFSAETPAGAAFDYLEDKARVGVPIPELIDRVCDEAFARSFRVERSAMFEDIGQLFQCRNKVAHRGELSYRLDKGRNKGKKIAVDQRTVMRWWESVVSLRDWLEALPEPQSARFGLEDRQ